MARPLPLTVKDHERLAGAIASSGRSYRELEAAAEVSRSMIGHLASGTRTTLTVEKAERLCSAIGVATSDLFEIPEFDRIARIAAGGAVS